MKGSIPRMRLQQLMAMSIEQWQENLPEVATDALLGNGSINNSAYMPARRPAHLKPGNSRV